MDREWAKRPPRYIKKNQEHSILRQKWGFTDMNANEAMERSRYLIVRLLANPIAWGSFSVPKANYFLSVLEFEARWKQGEFRSRKEFWMGPGENEEPVDVDAYTKKVDGKAYYEKARTYLNMLLVPSELEFNPKGE